MPPRSHMRSPYMEFAKLRSGAKYNLATSGIMSYPLSELPVRIQDLEINGPNVHGTDTVTSRYRSAWRDTTAFSPDCVFASAGTSMSNHSLWQSTFDPGDEVLIEHPTYELLESTALFLGATLRRFERRFEDGFRIDPAEVERNITPAHSLIILTNLHNPSWRLRRRSHHARCREKLPKLAAHECWSTKFTWRRSTGTARVRHPSWRSFPRHQQSDQGVRIERTPMWMGSRQP